MFIINHKKIFIGISLLLMLISVIFIATFGLNLGIDFKGGALAEVRYPDARPEISVLKERTDALDIGNVLIQPAGEQGYLVKTRDLAEDERAKLFSALSLEGQYEMQEQSFTSIGPSIGGEIKRKALISITLVILAIIAFVAFAFRQVSKPIESWKYGLIAIVALIHDVLIPAGIFSLLGYFFGAEADMLFVVALLTIMGLSVNDTIVIFDRVRENIKNKVSTDFSETVGLSIRQTIARSVNTSITVIFALLALYFFGPASTKYFALVLTAGMFFGTYSSIFLAAPLLVVAEKWRARGSRQD
jgi:preprotein translocase subunit SecF